MPQSLENCTILLQVPILTHACVLNITLESNVSCRFAWSWCCRVCAYKANVDHLALACIYSSQLLSHSLESFSPMFPNPNLIVVVYKLHYASVFCALPEYMEDRMEIHRR
jgi:hypothetical protein